MAPPSASAAAGGLRPTTPQHWILAWACLGRSFSLFARYEQWVMEKFGERYRYDLSLRLQHLSNGGLAHPNPGINFLQMRLAYHFD